MLVAFKINLRFSIWIIWDVVSKYSYWSLSPTLRSLHVWSRVVSNVSPPASFPNVGPLHPTLQYFFMYMCVWCMWIYHVSIVHKPEVDINRGVFPLSLSTLFFETVSPTEPVPQWFTRKPKLSSPLYLLSPRIIDICHHTQFFYVSSRDQIQVLILVWKILHQVSLEPHSMKCFLINKIAF